MEIKRAPFQGVYNIIRFNWHFYCLAAVLIVFLFFSAGLIAPGNRWYLYGAILLIALPTILSLFVSFYIYDVSGLYKLEWLNQYRVQGNVKVINVTAGFDETSLLLQEKLNNPALQAFDFFDPEKHTEVSIRRARKAYAPFPGTRVITTDCLPLAGNSVDQCFAILSAHEIRNEAERITFFKELRRVTRPEGQIFVTEHLRDLYNLIAYNIGFLHFHSRAAWKNTFAQAGLEIKKEIKLTPFITTFVLEKDGNTF